MEVLGEIASMIGAAYEALRQVVPNLDGWLWLALFVGSWMFGIRSVWLHMRRGKVAMGGAVLAQLSHTDAGGATMFRSAQSVAAKPSLSPFYGRPAYLRALPYPTLVVLVWLWVYLRMVLVVLAVVLLAMVAWKVYVRVMTGRHHREIVKPLAAVLAPALEMNKAQVLEGMLIPPNYADQDAVLRVPLPDTWRPDQLANVSKLVHVRLGGEWSQRRSEGAPYYLTYSHKPTPPTFVDADTVAHFLTEGDVWHPFLGIGTERESVRLDFTGPVVHLGVTAGTGAGKSVLNLLLGSQILYHGGECVGIDVAGNSFDSLEGIPGFHVHNDVDRIEEMWDAIHAVRVEMDMRRRGRRGNSEVGYDPLYLFLEEQNMFADFTAEHWDKVRDKSDPKICPVWDDIRKLYFMARQYQIRVIGTYQQMTADAVGGGNGSKGGAMRAQFGNKLMARFTASAWDAMIGTRPRGVLPDIQGRWLLVKNSGMTKQIQVPFFQHKHAVELLRQSKYGLAPMPVPPVVPQRSGRHPYEITASAPGRGDGDPLTGRILEARIETADAVAPRKQPERRYTLQQACEAGILPLNYEAAKRRRTRAAKAGREIPEGTKDGRTTLYTEGELRQWWDSETEAEMP